MNKYLFRKGDRTYLDLRGDGGFPLDRDSRSAYKHARNDITKAATDA
jgi:hypothetical protein